MSTVEENKKKRNRAAKLFQTTFGKPLKDYFDNATGFDLIKFDEEILQSGGDESVGDAIESKFGEDGANIILFLID